MAVQNSLIMNLLRIITPEEIADIATKHNGGKFLSLTDLVNERVERKIYRDFSSTDSIDEIHEAHALLPGKESAKILPFGKKIDQEEIIDSENPQPRFVVQARPTSQLVSVVDDQVVPVKSPDVVHAPDENMASFILIEKARFKASQKTLKQKEIIDLYQKNSNMDVEHIKSTNQSTSALGDGGVLVNKKHF